MIVDNTYQPEKGQLVADEQFVTSAAGERYLSLVRVNVRVRLPHTQAEAIARQHHHARVYAIADSFGDAAEIEIPLHLSDADLKPYLEWRDMILRRIYDEAGD